MRTFQRLFLASLLGFVPGCPPLISPVAMPPGLQSAGDRYPMSGGVNLFQHTVKFGPYAARHAWAGAQHEEVIARATIANNQVEQSVEKQKAWFDFSVPSGAPFRGECHRETVIVTQYFRGGLFGKGKELRKPAILERNRRTWCTLTREGGGTIRFATDGPDSNEVHGSSPKLTISSLAWRAAPYETTSGKTGYSLEAGTVSIAAVDLSWSEAVTLHSGLTPDQQDEAAVVCMALYMTSTMYE
jgi:hypothetical protein